ncbi:uncharacterized protein IL334_000049 [Kwoniella shivajii]|uniref:Uncharacterized protein n=1 Tax=Kwoniella shivajii TaxID=564305 RepID=A0ABZ1CN15_9TREE|nr:hypothetical protein IL334_000049 [Kwoniella shivajii]
MSAAGPSRAHQFSKVTNLPNQWDDASSSPDPPSLNRHSLKSPNKASVGPSGRQSPSSSVASASPRRSTASPRTVRRRPPPQIPSTPRSVTKNQQQQQQQQQQTQPRKPQQNQQPKIAAIPLADTLNVLLTPLRLILLPFNIFLGPFFAHLANAFLLITIASFSAYFLLPLLPSIILKLLGKSIRYLSNDFLSRAFGFAQDSDIMLGKEVFLLPAKTLATPACLLAGLFCETSLLAQIGEDGTRAAARPFWASVRSDEDDVDVAQYARALTKEARGARDIFDSVRTLGHGGVAGGLEYVRIWELAVAVNTGSSLEGKGFIAEQLRELGDMTRDLSDEIVHIDSKTVNAFSWLQWEFRDLVNLLSLPPGSRPETTIISRKLHSLLLRLSTELDSIYSLTSTAAQHASHASSHGQGLDTELSRTANGLKYEADRSPGWKRVYDKSAHFLVGGEPSKTELLDRDLRLTTKTIGNIRALSRSLEETRTKIKVYRDQVGMFGASMMGFHLGAGEEVGLSPEEEVRILGEVVEGLGRAVGMAKEEAKSGRIEVLAIDE